MSTAVVFLASAATLVLEIVAMRLVAPYVGVTLQTSSAVIGTALAAMALGAWAGGKLADRLAPARLIGPVLVLGGLLALLTTPVVRQVGGHLQDAEGGDLTKVLLLALLAVFPPSAVLSAVTPMVVKLQLAGLDRTGSVVGRLSGIATLGAIVATFLTGFVLLAHLRTSVILTGTGALLVATGAGYLATRPNLVVVAATLVAVPAVPWLFLASPNPCQVETDYHCARVEQAPPGSSGRELRLDTLTHSFVDLEDPTALSFEYTRAMAAAMDVTMDAARAPRQPVRSLFIGGGGFTLPRYQAATRPGSTAAVLEIDPGVVEIGRHQLGAGQIPGMTVRVEDGRTGVAREGTARYDVVVGDAFGGVAVPWHLTTRQAVQDIHRVLRPDGVYVLNVIDYAPDAFARAEIATLRAVFPHVAVAAAENTLRNGHGGNHVLIASASPLPLDQISDRLHSTTPGWGVLDPAGTAAFAGSAEPLRDELAPVDQLLTTKIAA